MVYYLVTAPARPVMVGEWFMRGKFCADLQEMVRRRCRAVAGGGSLLKGGTRDMAVKLLLLAVLRVCGSLAARALAARGVVVVPLTASCHLRHTFPTVSGATAASKRSSWLT